MKDASIDEAAAILADLRVRAEGSAVLTDLPGACRPGDLAEAYRVQRHLRRALAERGFGEQTGWKIGCTTPVMQEYLDIPHPCAGTLYRKTTYREHATLSANDFFTLGLECEIAVRLGDDLPRRATPFTADTVVPAVDVAMASIEIVEHRFANFREASVASLIADDFFSWGCVTGQPVPLGEIADPAALTGGFSVNDAEPEQTGTGSAILGHPLTALAWLADHAADVGTPLQRGQIVTLGSVVKTIYPERGQAVSARFEGLPPATVTIT